VTLVLSVHSRDHLWLLADRRLTYGGRRPPVDDAVKVMELETTDGVGVLAYAGLGATAYGTQPSDWMSAVLRGRGGLTFEQALGVLASVATKELPPHLARTPGGGHTIIVPAFVQGIGSRLYTIDIVDAKNRKHRYRFTSRQRTAEPGSPSIRLAAGGTGGLYLSRQDPTWRRVLFDLVKAHDRGKVRDHFVADHLAALNYEVHQALADGTVGPRSVVVWRGRRDGRPGQPGGAHQFYTGVDRDGANAPLPTISNGLDVQALLEVMWKQFTPLLGDPAAVVDESRFRFDTDEVNRQLAKLPEGPDEKLR